MNKEHAYLRDLSPYREQMVSSAMRALKDDLDGVDLTTDSIVRDRVVEGFVHAKSEGVLCGLWEVESIMSDGGVEVREFLEEGDSFKEGDLIIGLKGSVSEILKRERTCLNFLQHLSGVATTTFSICSQFPGQVAATRKVVPGLLFSEKRAVIKGGGLTHRVHLSDGFLIKDNHIASVIVEKYDSEFSQENKKKAIWECLLRAREYRKERDMEWPIEIEIESLEQALSAVEYFQKQGVPDMLLLDNFSPEELEKVVKKVRSEVGKGLLLEASGGINPNNLSEFLNTGVDVASMSHLTLAAQPKDFNLIVEGYK